MENPVIILGANNTGITALEIFDLNKVMVYGFLDDDTQLHGTEIHAVTVLGSTDDEGYTKLIGKKCEAFVAIEHSKAKKSVIEFLIDTRKVMPVNAIHPKAHISGFATIGHGNLLAAGATVVAKAQVGSHCILHANSIVESGAVIEDYATIGAGSIIGAGATVQEGAFVGAGVTIVAGVTIGKGASVGAGSVVVGHVKARQTVFGMPAMEVK